MLEQHPKTHTSRRSEVGKILRLEHVNDLTGRTKSKFPISPVLIIVVLLQASEAMRGFGTRLHLGGHPFTT